MICRKPNDEAWFNGGVCHDHIEIGVPSFWFTSWVDISITPNLALFNPVKNNSKDATIRDNQYLVIAPALNFG
jgi:predicted acyl esterase